jgi:hypothetical protein
VEGGIESKIRRREKWNGVSMGTGGLLIGQMFVNAHGWDGRLNAMSAVRVADVRGRCEQLEVCRGSMGLFDGHS